MAKLYPPYLEAKLPAFTGNTIVIPFELNRAVSIGEIKSIAYIIKTSSTGIIKWQGTDATWYQENDSLYYAQIILPSAATITQFYKIQLAFINEDGEIGYYSDVGIAKCTSQPQIYIDGLTSENINLVRNEYVGVYNQTGGDVSEKVYQYEFVVREPGGAIVATSGAQLHNSALDKTNYQSSDSWSLPIELDRNIEYTITYTVQTLNNLSVESPIYSIFDVDTVDLNTTYYELIAEPLNDDGIALVTLKRPEQLKNEKDKYYIRGSWKIQAPFTNDATSYVPNQIVDFGWDWQQINKQTYHNFSMKAIFSDITATGRFVISRYSAKAGWQKMYYFELVQAKSVEKIWHKWEDLTVEQGVQYRYAIQAYNSEGVFTNRLLANKAISVDFEDAFLYDGERQLNIRFNPKVSSFKTTILENKQDTLGSKYPFIFRNGYVSYKDFPISGLISMHMDESNRFIKANCDSNLRRVATHALQGTRAEIELLPNHKTNLNNNNFYLEREFKHEVVNWLSNGKPKLFRSPGEGNYIVRLMNVSLTPNDTLGRMLHTFNCQAYEIADCNLNSMTELGLFNNKDDSIATGTKMITLSGDTLEYNFTDFLAYDLQFNNLPSNTFITLTFEDQTTLTYVVPAGGDFSLEGKHTKGVSKCEFNRDKANQDFTIIYSYRKEIDWTESSNIKKVSVEDQIVTYGAGINTIEVR